MEKGQQIIIRLRVTLPVKASDEEIKEWARFRLGNNGSMAEGPLADCDLEADWVTFGNI